MSRRNFILLLIVLVVIGVILLFLFAINPSSQNNGDNGGGFFSNLNPFGKTTAVKPKTPTNQTGDNNIPNTPQGETTPIKLIKISTMPIAGYTVFPKEKVAGESHPALRYVDRATGNIYQTFADDVKERKFSNTLIPKVYEALFGNDGNTVIMRYLKADNRTIQTFIGSLPIEKLGDDSIITSDVQGTFLPDNISDISISPDGTKAFYLLEHNDGVVGIVMNLTDSKKTQIFDSPFTEWLSSWLGDKNVNLTTKAASVFGGYVYNIDINKKVPMKTLGAINGLTSLANPNGKSIIFSDNTLSTKTYDLSTRESNTLSVNTLPEKCIWDKMGVNIYCAVPKNTGSFSYPDSWYQGETSFNDQIWKIDTSTNTANFLIDPSTVTGEEVDGIKLMLDQNENFLFFVNKKDSFLWELDLRN